MSTNASISIRIGNKIKTIYSHWDGYPEYLGKLLKEHYNTESKVKELICLGNVSILKESTFCPAGHTFDEPVEGYSIFYGRDRKELDQGTRVYENLKKAMEKENEEFNYLWDKKHGWRCKKENDKKFIDLKCFGID